MVWLNVSIGLARFFDVLARDFWQVDILYSYDSNTVIFIKFRLKQHRILWIFMHLWEIETYEERIECITSKNIKNVKSKIHITIFRRVKKRICSGLSLRRSIPGEAIKSILVYSPAGAQNVTLEP